jgi:hypothetical protein
MFDCFSRWHQTCPPNTNHEFREGRMSDRFVGGAVAAVAALLTLVQLLWMFGMFSPASALDGRNGVLYASLLAGWLFVTLAPLAGAAIILLMTGEDSPVRR